MFNLTSLTVLLNTNKQLTNTTDNGIIYSEVITMKFITTKEAAEKWEISERRIRQLLEEGRIEGAIKNGNSWNIPDYAIKPVDKRSVKPDNKGFIIDLPVNFFDKVDNMKKELDSKRPFPKETLRTLKESINLEWTYNSNGIEGNTLTLREI